MASRNTVTYGVKIVAELPWIWEHQCGYLNRGHWAPGAVCLGCRYEVRDAPQVHLHLLIDAEPEEA